MTDSAKYDEELEFMSELVEECLREEGYVVQRYEETKHRTSAYRGIFVTDRNGKVYTLYLDTIWKEISDDER